MSASDSIQANAQIALAAAVTTRTTAILLDQLNGALPTAVQGAIAAIEAEHWSAADSVIRELLERREVGLHLTAPWRVVLVGAPNVGKSSLINALAGYDRAIVSPTPGTTRDVVTVTTAIDGWPMLLADTAGMRTTTDELESAGVELAQAALAAADLAIVVHDATAATSSGEPWSVTGSPRVIHVRNKIDLLTANDDFADAAMLPVSAFTGEGIGELVTKIGQALVPNPPATSTAVPFMQEQIEALVIARNAIQRQHAPAATEALQSMLAAGGSGFGVQGSE